MFARFIIYLFIEEILDFCLKNKFEKIVYVNLNKKTKQYLNTIQ
jgi:hypothetical protein